MNAIEFAYDYIYHHDHFRERHPNFKKYRFGRLKGRHKGTISTLYRGLYFQTKEDYQRFQTQIEDNNWTVPDISSWSLNKDVAFHFVAVPYVKKKQTGYCGVVVKIENVPNTCVLFDSLIAHWQFKRLGKTFPDDKPYTDEGEIVLKPMSIKVAFMQQLIFSEIEENMKIEKDNEANKNKKRMGG